jgi:hypothetical protein
MKNLTPPKTTALTQSQAEHHIAEIIRHLRASGESMLRAASHWSALRQSGYDLTSLRKQIGLQVAALLDRIACGTLVPEVLTSLLGNLSAARAIESLPPERQRELATGAPVKVADPSTGNTLEIPLVNMRRDALAVVFHGGIERSPEEQLYIHRQSQKKKPQPEKLSKPRLEVESKTIKIGHAVAAKKDVLSALASESGPYVPLPKDVSGNNADCITITLQIGEADRIKKNAADMGLKTNEAIRLAIHNMGLFADKK